MTHTVPAAPLFGEPAPIEASPQTLAFLARRRSASAVTLGEPAPNDADLATLLRLAARAPDHGKLSPWRFVVLRGAAKQRFVAGLEQIAAGRPDAVKVIAKLAKIKAPPLTVAVVSRLLPGDIPEWEQRLSAGAACMNLIIAAQAMGYGANWITDWYAYDEAARRLLGLRDGERVAGFVHLGTPADVPLERVRPDMDAVVEHWNG
ncbi:MAG TPA: nitroreductase [Caulobacteraceae bacterium]|nr:nitroreductase [Caulobacteraceae bacterium]